MTIVIFDSTVPEGEAAPVCCEARAEEVPEPDRARAIAACGRRAEAIGDSTFTAAEVVAPAQLRPYA